ncbi:MAG: 50S ribosomal protein L22 [Candidatus Omnitrophica bacterium]|nr:50S ribosomal protein L22 [Candidatus Omnitrophota bacterium]MCG2702908.1 50S ribosomal protein L22 [Candidatus Omnitrophota bacterium]
MIASAKARHIRMSARKARIVLTLVRGKPAQQALSVLENTRKKAALVVNKLLRSALANAKNKGIEEEGLYVSKIHADEGATWKRFRAASFGRASRVRKRTCHITVELDKKIIVPKVKVAEAAKKKRTSKTETEKQ